ncbi:MAG: GNAT family N-acetyltransferase [Firmicutes bacterium]|nr:GNAT family N-acetyltransferase [Bacillota bacterium]
MIRLCREDEFDIICEIINDAATAYRGVIPDELCHDPYMPREELRQQLESGITFWGWVERDELVGVMGIQPVQDVTLIRHAYVRTAHRGRGIGGELLSFLRRQTDRRVLIGTWADADWAVRFYEQHGFRRVGTGEKERLLHKYWGVPQRQVENSVVLAEAGTNVK